MNLNIRKIAVVGSFAAGAALALAPMAAADPVDISSTIDSEIASLNATFESQAALAGVGDDVIPGTATNPFDTIPVADVNPTFASLLYGVDPTDNAVLDPGSYVVFNGSTTEFDDAYNVVLYSALNNGSLISPDDLIGSSSTITDALSSGSVMDAFDTFVQAGFADLAGYLF